MFTDNRVKSSPLPQRRAKRPWKICAERDFLLAPPLQIVLMVCESRKRYRLIKQTRYTHTNMAKALSKSQLASELAEKSGLTKKAGAELLDTLAALAYKHAKNTFTLPGIGKLVLVNRKARIGRNPATGESIQIPAKKVVKFRVAKAAKDAILGAR
jgi:DNA-binding protein HU-beta